MGADERQLRTNLPKPAVGFQPPLPLIINIQIARATGEIMTSFYGNSTVTQSELVRKIQATLQGLYETGRSIPNYLAIDFDTTSNISVTRTSASLYLMLFQAIILCIRPIILQGVKDKVQASIEDRPQMTRSPIITRLWSSCREAAIKSIRILSSLRRDNSIALFGYFDLDATFSAAFILLMMGFVDSSDMQRPPEGIAQAAEVLRYLSEAGNGAAQRRLEELKQFCRRVWSPPENVTAEWAWLREDFEDFPMGSTMDADITNDPTQAQANNTANHVQQSSTGAIEPARAMTATPSAWQNVADDLDVAGGADLDNFFNDFPTNLGDEMGGIYSSYNDPTLPLTGIDEVDWAEVGKMFHLKDMAV